MSEHRYRGIAFVWISRPFTWLFLLAGLFVLPVVYFSHDVRDDHSAGQTAPIHRDADVSAGQQDTDELTMTTLLVFVSFGFTVGLLTHLESQFAIEHAAVIPGYTLANRRFAFALAVAICFAVALASSWRGTSSLVSVLSISSLTFVLVFGYRVATFAAAGSRIASILIQWLPIALTIPILFVSSLRAFVIRFFPALESSLQDYYAGDHPLIALSVVVASGVAFYGLLLPYKRLGAVYCEQGWTPTLSLTGVGGVQRSQVGPPARRANECEASRWDRAVLSVDGRTRTGRIKLIWLRDIRIPMRAIPFILAFAALMFSGNHWDTNEFTPSNVMPVAVVFLLFSAIALLFRGSDYLQHELLLPTTREQFFSDRFLAYFLLTLAFHFAAVLVAIGLRLFLSDMIGVREFVFCVVAVIAFSLIGTGTSMWFLTLRSVFAAVPLTIGALIASCFTAAVLVGLLMNHTNHQWLFADPISDFWFVLPLLLCYGVGLCATARFRWLVTEFGQL